MAHEYFLKNGLKLPLKGTSTRYLQIDSDGIAVPGKSDSQIYSKSTITFSSHNCSIGTPVTRLSNGSFVKSKADTAENAEVYGVVSEVVDENTIRIQQIGEITYSNNFTGPAIFLSATTAGALTETAPNQDGQYIKCLYQVLSSSSLLAVNFPSFRVGVARTTYPLTFTNSSLVDGKLTVNHNLSTQFGFVIVIDNNKKVIYPDDVTFTNGNSLEVDLTSYGTISGNWRLLFMSEQQDMWTQIFTNDELDTSSVKFIDITHNLNSDFVLPVLIDNNNKMVIPDDFIFTSDDVMRINLTSLAPITGSWRVIVRR